MQIVGNFEIFRVFFQINELKISQIKNKVIMAVRTLGDPKLGSGWVLHVLGQLGFPQLLVLSTALKSSPVCPEITMDISEIQIVLQFVDEELKN